MIKKAIATFAVAFLSLTAVMAKDFKTVVFKVAQMECPNCEKKVKNNIKFEKGIKEFTTDVKTQMVTITYDADKTNVEKLQAGFKKFKYEAVEVKDEKKDQEKK